jgi:ech hydrogenase subunit F
MLDIFKTLMVSMFKKPVTVAYPNKPIEYSKVARGHIEIDIESCIFCGMCSRKCPTTAIEVDRNERTWEINRFCCIQCGCCVEVCPKKCLAMGAAQTPAASVITKELVRDARVPANEANH